MKFILLCLCSIPLFAQTSLMVRYDKLSIPVLLGPDGKKEKLDPEIVAFYKTPSKYELTINNEIGQYFEVIQLNNSQGGTKVRMIGFIPKNFEYNVKTQQITTEFLIQDKPYLVDDILSNPDDFELTRESGRILGYDVRKAIAKDDQGSMVVWYAPSLPQKFGPKDHYNFPGLVLSVEYFPLNESISTYSIKATEVMVVDQPVFKKLHKGKRLTKEAYEALKNEIQAKDRAFMNQGVDKG